MAKIEPHNPLRLAQIQPHKGKLNRIKLEPNIHQSCYNESPCVMTHNKPKFPYLLLKISGPKSDLPSSHFLSQLHSSISTSLSYSIFFTQGLLLTKSNLKFMYDSWVLLTIRVMWLIRVFVFLLIMMLYMILWLVSTN